MAERLGITSLTRPDYGLSLTLGGGEVSLLEMTGGYAVIANGGLRVPPLAITRIVDFQGNVIYEYQPTVGEQVLRPEHAFLMASILSDNAARTPVFGPNSLLNLPFQVAAKTGTSNDSRDNWTLGFTPDVAVGVWVGNADYTPMADTTGVTGAGPIWSEFMTYAIYNLTNDNPTAFVRPAGVVKQTICKVSGTQPSQWCPAEREEYFAADQPPSTPEHDLWRELEIDTWTKLEASPECADFTEELMTVNVKDEDGRTWILEDERGRQWARELGFNKIFFSPERKCRSDDPHPRLQFTNLQDGQTLLLNLQEISIIANADGGFVSWRLDWGVGEDPSAWTPLIGDNTASVTASTMVYIWDLSGFPQELVTLRLRMQAEGDGFAEKKIHLNLNIPVPTPTPTESPTPTATFTPSPLPTETPFPTFALPADLVTPTETTNP